MMSWLQGARIKKSNNTICNLNGEYKKIELDCREGVRTQLERIKELRKKRNNLYEKQNDLKGQKQKIEKSLGAIRTVGRGYAMPDILW